MPQFIEAAVRIRTAGVRPKPGASKAISISNQRALTEGVICRKGPWK
jgi:hypothetical protein